GFHRRITSETRQLVESWLELDSVTSCAHAAGWQQDPRRARFLQDTGLEPAQRLRRRDGGKQRAAPSHKVALSQSDVSHSLARLREILEDDLFVRTATGMQPTTRALTMAPQVREALRILEATVELPTFVPATSTKQFTLAANDFTTMVLASPLLKLLSRFYGDKPDQWPH
ncbi:LysR family transcriptional regulator, partial [Bradyrhizobium yuanmingense]|uniref:LysR family transcriptional regulator n=1 Tax=Bradyrhizobium yuanmingense TaxID=108015 RepID=UPI001FD31802